MSNLDTPIASNSFLSTLYSQFSQTTHHRRVIKFLNNPISENYDDGFHEIKTNWIENNTDLLNFLGLAPSAVIDGLRVQVILADGNTAYDSHKTEENNKFHHINKMNINNEYYINENQNTRSYNMGAALSSSGIFYQTKMSHSTGTKQMYIAVRQGSVSAPLGNIVISMNTNN